MSSDEQTPILVGVAAVAQRFEDPAEASEPIELMGQALERAAEDAGSRGLLAKLGRIGVPRGFWAYSDPGRLLAERVSASAAKTILAEIGVLQQTLIGDACRAIANGECTVAAVVGGEAKYRSLRASIAGVEASETPQSATTPDERWQPAESLWTDLEFDRGLYMPVGYYAIMENAFRYAKRQSLEDHRHELAELYAGFSEIAARNPDAWNPKRMSAAEIATPSAKNPMIAFPYAKLHNTSWNVDQSGALLFCSVAEAKRTGIPESQWVYPLASTESNHMLALALREDIARCPGFAIAGQRALDIARIAADELTHLELYSCFPIAVRLAAHELSLAGGSALTVTGGMPFAGGPLNNYVIQSTVRMAQQLRESTGGRGLVSSVSGLLTKQGFGLWSSEASGNLFRFEDCTREVGEAMLAKELRRDTTEAGTIAGYTVLHAGGAPSRGIAICDLPDGARTVTWTERGELMVEMESAECCARKVEIQADGQFEFA